MVFRVQDSRGDNSFFQQGRRKASLNERKPMFQDGNMGGHHEVECATGMCASSDSTAR